MKTRNALSGIYTRHTLAPDRPLWLLGGEGLSPEQAAMEKGALDSLLADMKAVMAGDPEVYAVEVTNGIITETYTLAQLQQWEDEEDDEDEDEDEDDEEPRTIRSLIENDYSHVLWRVPTPEGTVVVSTGDLEERLDWDIERRARWRRAGFGIQITDGSLAPPYDRWERLTEDEENRVWEEASTKDSPEKKAEIDRRVNGGGITG